MGKKELDTKTTKNLFYLIHKSDFKMNIFNYYLKVEVKKNFIGKKNCVGKVSAPNSLVAVLGFYVTRIFHWYKVN